MATQEKNNWEGREVTVNFTTLLPGGRSLGIYENREITVLGVLPGEQAVVQVAKHKKSQLIADVTSLVKQNKYRIEPREDHYLSCSPWQIMPYEEQLRYKKLFIRDAFIHADNSVFNLHSVTSSPNQWGYRTKIEFGVQQIDGMWSLALHSNNSNIPASAGCLLASREMNAAALSALQLLQDSNADMRDIKSIVVRESKTMRQLLVVIYVLSDVSPTLSSLPLNATSLVIAKSDPEKLISVPQKILQTVHSSTLSETISGLIITYPFNSFFQNNVPLYETVLKDIARQLPHVDIIIDMYAGVGIIGLSLHYKAKRIIAYEVSADMTKAANINAKANAIFNYEAKTLSDLEVLPRHFAQADAVIVNPTRRGLNDHMINILRKNQPEYIVYLSCNYKTQARDFTQLQAIYEPVFFKAYDFYPNTAHVETLLILKKKKQK